MCVGWHALDATKAVTHVPQVYLGNRDLLDGSYVCPNHKQELSSVYQFIDVLYNLRCLLSSSDDDFIKSDSLSADTVLCSTLSTCHTWVTIGCCRTWGMIGYCLVSVAIGCTPWQVPWGS